MLVRSVDTEETTTYRRSQDLVGRVALVTGGGRGIGRAIAMALARNGATVAVNYRRDRASASETVRELRAIGARSESFRASVTSPVQCARMVERIEARLGPISILVNNAGVASTSRLAIACNLTEVEELWRTNTLGPLRLCQAALPAMRALPRGDIIMISSMATTLWPAFGLPYNVAKAGMEALAFTMAREELPHGIRVNVVAPGLVSTEMGRRLVRAQVPDTEIEELDARAPFGRVCRPEDVANVVAFLVSPAGSYITGERIRVDGGAPGLHARRPAKPTANP